MTASLKSNRRATVNPRTPWSSANAISDGQSRRARSFSARRWRSGCGLAHSSSSVHSASRTSASCGSVSVRKSPSNFHGDRRNSQSLPLAGKSLGQSGNAPEGIFRAAKNLWELFRGGLRDFLQRRDAVHGLKEPAFRETRLREERNVIRRAATKSLGHELRAFKSGLAKNSFALTVMSGDPGIPAPDVVAADGIGVQIN